MPYTHTNSKGQTYYLHAKRVRLQNGRDHTLYYFSPALKPAEVIEDLPVGHRIVEGVRTALPYLKHA